MSLTGSRPWVIGGAILSLLMLGVTWLLMVSPTRSDASSLREDTVAVQTQNDVLQAKNAALEEQDGRREELAAETRAALTELPPDVALPELNQELAQHAAARGVQITSISVGGATATATDGSVSDASGATPTTGTLSVPITVETSGPALAQLFFLRDLQEVGPRAALVTSTSLSQSTSTDSTTTDGAGPDPTDPDTADPDTADPDTVPTTLTTQFVVFASALAEADEALLDEMLGAGDTD